MDTAEVSRDARATRVMPAITAANLVATEESPLVAGGQGHSVGDLTFSAYVVCAGLAGGTLMVTFVFVSHYFQWFK